MAEEKLVVNQAFAAKYVERKEREERSHLREKYGDILSGSSSESSSDEEDEDGEGITSDVERDFLRTLSLIKNKDPAIYDASTTFYGSEASSNKVAKMVEKKPTAFHLKDYERQQLLERGSMAGVSDSESDWKEDEGLTYSEEQKQLKESFKAAANLDEDVVNNGERVTEKGELLVLRQKTQKEKAVEEEEYVQWLRGEGGQVASEMAKDLAPLKEYWSDPCLNEGEKFLRDFILNKGYLECHIDRVPTYNEVVESEPETTPSEDESPPNDSGDEESVEKQEVFERRYNFRFEEPDADLITSYPRTLGCSVRHEDDRRKKKRKEKMEKKAKEAQARKEEIRRLRNLQQKEMTEKLEKLSRITGNPVESFGLSIKDLETDFDPEAYDDVMQTVFNDNYYHTGEKEDKPEFSDMEGEDWNPGSQTDFDHNMDADYLPQEEGKSKRKRRRGTLREEEEETAADSDLLQRYNYEGHLKGELFRYRQVEPNDFGLTTDEILWSDNKELNRWSSLSKAVQYRTRQEEQKDKKRFLKKARNWDKKKAILTSCYTDKDEDSPIPSKKRKKEMAKRSKKGHTRKTWDGKVSAARLKSYGL